VGRFSAFLKEVNERFAYPVQLPAFPLVQAVMMCGLSQLSDDAVQVTGFFEEDFDSDVMLYLMLFCLLMMYAVCLDDGAPSSQPW
jgi:hypothetical protein